MYTQLAAEPISAENFAVFGELLENKTDHRRRDFHLQSAGDYRPQLWVNRLPRLTDRLVLVDVMESHPYSVQTFVPMQPGRCLVVVAPMGDDGKPDLQRLRAFLTQGGQGVSYRPNIWHYTFSSVDGPNEVVVMMGYTGRGDDTVLETLTTPVQVAVTALVHGEAHV